MTLGGGGPSTTWSGSGIWFTITPPGPTTIPPEISAPGTAVFNKNSTDNSLSSLSVSDADSTTLTVRRRDTFETPVPD